LHTFYTKVGTRIFPFLFYHSHPENAIKKVLVDFVILWYDYQRFEIKKVNQSGDKR